MSRCYLHGNLIGTCERCAALPYSRDELELDVAASPEDSRRLVGMVNGEPVFVPSGMGLAEVLAAMLRQACSRDEDGDEMRLEDSAAHDPRRCRCQFCDLVEHKPLELNHLPASDILIVEGIRYSGEIFRVLASSRDGDTFAIRRNGTTLEMKRRPELVEADPFLGEPGPPESQRSMREMLDRHVPKLLKDSLVSVVVERQLVREPPRPGDVHVRRIAGKKWKLTVVAKEE